MDRTFALRFAAYLNGRMVHPNGRLGAERRVMKGQAFVLDAVRAMFKWSADPDRGRLMPDGFRNPFLLRIRPSTGVAVGAAGEPDITVAMAVDMISACDAYGLALIAPMILYGLRAAEPCFLFREYVGDGQLSVPCNPDLNYVTKGRRNKEFPLIDVLDVLRKRSTGNRPHGLLYVRRSVAEGRVAPPLLNASLTDLVAEYQRRCARAGSLTAAARLAVRKGVLHDGGGLSYDDIQGEFARIAARLKWPRSATLKDLRHLFATCLEKAGMPELYRKYLMGHSPGRAAVVTYTHLNKVREHYQRALETELQPQWFQI